LKIHDRSFAIESPMLAGAFIEDSRHSIRLEKEAASRKQRIRERVHFERCFALSWRCLCPRCISDLCSRW
jgi:hypothetical protein